MTLPLLSRPMLARVLTSLLQSELKVSGAAVKAANWLRIDRWPGDLRMGEEGTLTLGCDSLDLLRLAAATNEMFHLYEARQELDLLAEATFGSWLDRIEMAWQAGVEQISFVTSGSTGKPKRCTHTFPHLRTEVLYLADVFADRSRVVPLTPAHHIYGFLFTAMLPDALGSDLSFPLDVAQDSVLRDLRRGDLVVSFPDRWLWLDRTISRWPEGVAGVVSTAPCPPDLAADLLTRGLESFTEIYGSSETAGLGLRRSPDSGYRFMPQWKVEDGNSPEGTLLVHTSGWHVRVNDHLDFHEDGSFTLAGRMDAAVQVGGINVYPAKIAAMIRNQPGVQEAVVRVSEYAQGRRLKAFVVPAAGVRAADLHIQLEAWMVTALSTVERPQSVVFGDVLPTDEMGKSCD